jgi:DNA-directed RNA polymerase specialized sigma24 family protein
VDEAVKARQVFAEMGDEDAPAPASEPGPERLAELAQARRCIDQCMRKLRAPHREVLALRVCGAELKESDVARLLGVPIGTVKSRTSIALRALAACVEQCAGSSHG